MASINVHRLLKKRGNIVDREFICERSAVAKREARKVCDKIDKNALECVLANASTIDFDFANVLEGIFDSIWMHYSVNLMLAIDMWNGFDKRVRNCYTNFGDYFESMNKDEDLLGIYRTLGVAIWVHGDGSFRITT